MNNWPHQRDVKTFYGNPDTNGDGVADRAWEDAYLVKVFPPFGMVLAWDTSQRVTSIRVHKKCADSLSRVLAQLALRFPTQALIDAARINLFGGSYSFRMKRGGTTLSMHSYACAIDLDPANNGMGEKWRGDGSMIHPLVIAAFKDWVSDVRYYRARQIVRDRETQR